MIFNEPIPSASRHWQHQLDRFCKQENLPGVVLSVYQESKEPIAWTGASGNLPWRQPYFISGVAKLHLAALMIKLKIRGKVDLSEPFRRYLPGKEYSGLCRIRNTDFTQTITLDQLLRHQSGLPDYLQLPFGADRSLKEALLSGDDREWTFSELLQEVRNSPAVFKPRTSGKPHESDTDFHLLGEVIEKVTGLSLEDALIKFQTDPLSMSETYVYNDPYDRTPAPFYKGGKAVHIPRAMACFGPTGGMVSTAQDCMVFLKSYIHGRFFPMTELEVMFDWSQESLSFSQGLGVRRYRKPWYVFPWGRSPEIIGQIGFTGAFSLYLPERNIFFTGTVNQCDRPLLPYKLVRFLLQTG
ncbi:serine hydrolase domain-containing protein [Cyclobacterium xiamenense]|uniref:serine hydrolase domain-containing protein n=1 Tax=Cyclobacterium xiamenense TaxID=1297121 RepID=UPI0035CEF0CF